MRDAAVTELLRRLRADALKPTHIDRIADRVLALQADDNVPWQPTWGEFVEIARANGRLDDARWERYLRHGIRLSVSDYRKVIRRGDNLPVITREDPSRLSTRFPYALQYTLLSWIDDQPREMFTEGPWRSASAIPGRPNRSPPSRTQGEIVRIRKEALDELADGPHRMTFKFLVSLHTRGSDEAQFRVRIDQPCNWTLVPAGTETLETVTDPAILEEAKAQIQISAVRTTSVSGGDGLLITLSPSALPVPIAGKLSVSARGYETLLADVVFRAPVFQRFHFVSPEGAKSENVDIILRTGPDAARKTVDIDRVLTGELLFKDVPVQSR